MAHLDSLKLSFAGKFGLVQFTDDPSKTTYLIDSESKTLKPFVNETAFFNRYHVLLKDYDQSQIAKIDSSVVATQGGALNDYKTLPNSQGVQIDGKIPKVDVWDSSQMSIHYGKPKDTELNTKTFERLIGKQGQPGLLDWLQNVDGGQIKSGTIEDIKKDKNKLAFYMNAVAYGNYGVDSLYKDILKNQKIVEGSTGLGDTMIINPYKTFDDYKITQDYTKAQTVSSLDMPSAITTNGIDWTLPLSSLPDEAWDIITPPLDINSPEFKAEMDKVKSAYYDVLMANMEATTVQEKAVADNQWEQLKDFTEKKYGLKLSENAVDAWSQIQTIGQSASQRGLSGSGILEEALQKQLQSTRRANDLLRESKVTEEEVNEINNLLKSGTDEQIDAYVKSVEGRPVTDDFSQEDKDRVLGMFKVSEEYKQLVSFEALKAANPELPDWQIKMMSESLSSPTGNRRSELYQNFYNNQVFNITDPSKGSIQAKLKDVQQTVVQEKGLRDEEKGAAELSPGGRFESAPEVKPPDPTVTTTPTGTTAKFRPRGANETLTSYLTAKQSHETKATGSSTISFGTPPVEKLPPVNVKPPTVDPNIAARNQLAQEAANLAASGDATKSTPISAPTAPPKTSSRAGQTVDAGGKFTTDEFGRIILKK